jgi:hypothetical protein
MLPTFLLEPSATRKRRAFAQALALLKGRPFPDLADLRAQMMSMRLRAVAELAPLEHRLVDRRGQM